MEDVFNKIKEDLGEEYEDNKLEFLKTVLQHARTLEELQKIEDYHEYHWRVSERRDFFGMTFQEFSEIKPCQRCGREWGFMEGEILDDGSKDADLRPDKVRSISWITNDDGIMTFVCVNCDRMLRNSRKENGERYWVDNYWVGYDNEGPFLHST